MDDVDLGNLDGKGEREVSELHKLNSAAVPRNAVDIACAEASNGAISLTVVWSCYWHGHKVIGMHCCPGISLLPEITHSPSGVTSTPSSSSLSSSSAAISISLQDRPAVDFLSVGLIHASHMSLRPTHPTSTATSMTTTTTTTSDPAGKHANDEGDSLTSTAVPSQSRAWVPVTVCMTDALNSTTSLEWTLSYPFSHMYNPITR